MTESLDQGKKKLEKTDSDFRLIGVVHGLTSPKAYKQTDIKSGENKGKKRREVAFRVKTSENNEVRVIFSGMEKATVNIKTKKEDVDDDKKKIAIPFAERLTFHQKYPTYYLTTGIATVFDYVDSEKDMAKKAKEFIETLVAEGNVEAFQALQEKMSAIDISDISKIGEVTDGEILVKAWDILREAHPHLSDVTFEKRGVYNKHTEFDAVDEILKGIKDGDTVEVSTSFTNGSVEFNEYTTEQGEKVKNIKFNGGKIVKLRESLDFNKLVPAFSEEVPDGMAEEVNTFEMEFVYKNSMQDVEAQKMRVYGYQIDYKGNLVNANFVIPMDNPELEAFAHNVNSILNLGDKITVFGKIINRPIYEDDQNDSTGGAFGAVMQAQSSSPFGSNNPFGGGKRPKHFEGGGNRRQIKGYENELRIHGIVLESYNGGKAGSKTYEKGEGYYTEEDLKPSQEQGVMGGGTGNNPFGGGGAGRNPFGGGGAPFPM